ncbi:DUF4123 domain-containing protein [Chitinivorax sp. B]|uniref:DUF4123 domain-containing protein n=1 Tax=Chitinivorax sp. B TaxID=2502235 RepID=UPI0010FA0882|nr:DUF4123 domain-containing protein [Chitinivorax sp. B]
MYIDPNPSHSLAVLTQHLSELDLTTYSIYALVDHAFHEQVLRAIQPLPNSWQNLMAHVPGATPDMSPLLITLNSIDSQWPTLAKLIALADGLPMLSVMASRHSLSALAAHFACYVDVAVEPDHDEYMLRFADTRTLPNLLAALSSDQRALMLGPLYRWWFRDREANWVAVSGGNETAYAKERLAITSAQFGQMLDTAIPDLIYSRLKHDMADWLPYSPALAIQQIESWVNQARQQGLQEVRDLQSYCLSQLMGPDE